MPRALKILAVDNEPSVILSLTFIFAGPRYQLTTVKSGEEALAKLGAEAEPYDVIIVDQKMPNLSGTELVCAIRERGGVNSKIMVLSAHVSSEVREAYYDLNVDVILTKPFDIADLRSAVERLAA